MTIDGEQSLKTERRLWSAADGTRFRRITVVGSLGSKNKLVRWLTAIGNALGCVPRKDEMRFKRTGLGDVWVTGASSGGRPRNHLGRLVTQSMLLPCNL